MANIPTTVIPNQIELDPGQIIAGVDTHAHTHHAAILNHLGRLLATEQFPTTTTGLAALHTWLTDHGTPHAVGVEGTGSYGAGLTHHLRHHDITVIEVDRPDRTTRRHHGKSDPIDAIAAAQAVLSGRATGTPKTRTGPVEAIRVLRTVRAEAVKARTAALNHLHALTTTAADPALRDQLRDLAGATLITHCARLRPTTTLTDPAQATKTALRRLARRIQALTAEITDADHELTALTTTVAPATTAVHGVGPHTAAQLLATAGDNPQRIATEASFARLCGVAPVPASSGNTTRDRLHRGGDRQANAALHRVVIVRMRHCARTRAYITRRTSEGKTKREIIRCLKRYVAREVYQAILTDLTNAQAAA
jgi:transposase